MKIRLKKKSIFIASFIILLIIAIAAMYFYLNARQQMNKKYQATHMQPILDTVGNLQQDKDIQIYVGKLTSLGYLTFLQEEEPYTIFAPDDSGYARLSTQAQSIMTTPDYEASLRQLLLYHIVKGTYYVKDFKDGMTLTTIQGDPITLRKHGNLWFLNDAVTLEYSDIKTKNGVIHVINDYLIPPSLQ